MITKTLQWTSRWGDETYRPTSKADLRDVRNCPYALGITPRVVEDAA